MKTLRHTEDSTPSEDPKTGPRKTLAKNAENVMFYHLRGVRAPRTSMDFQPYLIYEDIRVLGSISKASRGVCVCVCVWGGGVITWDIPPCQKVEGIYPPGPRPQHRILF